MLVGSDIATAVTTLEALPVDVIGLNCATGPDLMQESVRHLGKTTTRTIMVMPNAGLPRNVGGKAVYDLTPAELARFQARFVTEFGIGVVGGCCGTTPEHVAAMAAAMQGLRPRERPKDYQPQLASLFHSRAARPGQRSADRRRAHQRQRLQEVQGADGHGRRRGHAADGQGAGARGLARARRLHRLRRSRRGRRHAQAAAADGAAGDRRR
jgi:hypothetical protein